jgi:hypothetical protein
VNYYVYSRGVKALSETSYIPVFKWIYWILALSFLVGQILERGQPSLLTRIVTHIGSVWMAVFLYLILFVLLVDVIRLFDSYLHFFPKIIIANIPNGTLLFVLAWSLALSITAYGWLNARYPRVHQLDIAIDKEIKGYDTLTIILATDLHMGAMIGKKRV